MAPGKLSATDVIELLELVPLPGEGGYFRQTVSVPGAGEAATGASSHTAILYLVTPDSWSGLHMLETDELFHFYMGDECRMAVCSPRGAFEERRLGGDLRTGGQVQSLVPGGMWQGTRLAPGGNQGFALLGTTMTPGFRRDQFRLATQANVESMPEATAAKLRPYLAPDA